MERIQLADGIFLNVIPSEKFKTEYFDINFVIPLREETASFAALLPLVLKRGCEKYPTMASLTKRLDFLYSTGFSARVSKRGEQQIVGFTADFLRDSFVSESENLGREVFGLLHDILFCPLVSGGSFKSEYVENEKKNLIDSINSLINNKNAYAMKKCHEAMCEGENYAVNEGGNVELVEKIDGASLYDFYKKLVSTSYIEMFYVGTAPAQAVKELVNMLFDGVLRGDVVRVKTVPFVRKRHDVQELCEKMEVAQGKLCMSFCSGSTFEKGNSTAYSVFNELYGGSPTSKLFENVREKMSLCYYCRSISDAHKGILTVASGIEVENKQKAYDEILAQLELAKNGDISQTEIDCAKKSLINAYKELLDDASSLSMWHLSRILGGDTRTLDDVIREVPLVTKEQIVECANGTVLDTVFFLEGTLKGGDEE